MSEWHIDTAPMGGTEIYVTRKIEVRAYYDEELKRWVLSRPLHIEALFGHQIESWTHLSPKPPRETG